MWASAAPPRLMANPPGGVDMLTLIALIVGLGIGGVATGAWLRASSSSGVRRSEEERTRIVADAEREAETIRREAQVEARELAVRLRADAEGEVQDRRVEIAKVEERIAQRESEIDHKILEVTVEEWRKRPIFERVMELFWGLFGEVL